MINVIEKLNSFGKGNFVKINETIYKSEQADALVLTPSELNNLVRDRVKEEIPFINNKILKKFLPKKLHNDLVLNELKELSKFDHTLLSNSITNIEELIFELLPIGESYSEKLADFILSDSKIEYVDLYNVIFVSDIELV